MSLCNFAKGFQTNEVSTYQVLSTTESQCQPRPWECSRLQGSCEELWQGKEHTLGALSVLIASTSATNLMCDLENAILQIPSASYLQQIVRSSLKLV